LTPVSGARENAGTPSMSEPISTPTEGAREIAARGIAATVRVAR
jgi:hypothetical protein